MVFRAGFWTSEIKCRIVRKNSEKWSDQFKMADVDRLKKARDVLRSHLIKLTSDISKVPVPIDRVVTETMEINLFSN